MSYDPIPYWIERGKNYQYELASRRQGKASRMFDAQESVFPKVIASLAPESVLEVGCGFGRMTHYISRIPSIKKYHALDVSPDEIRSANLSIHNVDFICSDFLSWQAKRKYDLVFACEVLLHIPPNQIKTFIGKMMELSIADVADLDYFEPKRTLKNYTLTRLHQGNYNHKYPEIYKEMGAKRVERIQLVSNRWYGIERHPQSIFVASKR